LYDGGGYGSDNSWEVSYISAADTVSLMYSRYGSMTPYEPYNRYIYIHIPKASAVNAYVSKSYATII
jgi:hypothetical protein